ncbi:MAG TPA: hypothetical protein PLU30_17935 [Verrucomicrobiae bacterium]|nr:hypothetical protein [Verrucomicrobiae bacterium]
MPEPSNIARAVLNSSNGRWYKYEREGDRLKALDPDGLILRPAGSGANAIDVYRVTDERGDFKAMVATAEKPATLKVWAKDPESDNLSLVEAVSCTAFAENRCRFVLAADYATFGNRAARLDFLDGTAGTITASYDEITLWEWQEDQTYQGQRIGTFQTLAAVIENLDDKRVVFESSDPSICRIERGGAVSDYQRVLNAPQQTDQYCVIIGVKSGECQVVCRSVADPSLEDSVTVTVATHPDDVPKVIGGDLAQELTGALHNMRCPVSLPARTLRPIGTPHTYTEQWNADYLVSGGGYDEPCTFWSRSIQIPGSETDVFDIDLNFAGTVLAQNPPPWNTYNSYGRPRFVLAIGLVEAGTLGRPVAHQVNYISTEYWDHLGELYGLLDHMGCAGARVVNNYYVYGASNNGIVTIDNDIAFHASGGDTIVIGWYLAPSTYEVYDSASLAQLPNGTWHALLTVNSITHRPHGEAA